MDADEARARFAAARVARLATVAPDGAPHLVPVVFAVVGEVTGDVVWSAVDDKPKSTRALRRLANIAAHPRVSLLVDHYDDDWTRLWWVRADGTARVLDATDAATRAGRDALVGRYPQYAEQPPAGPFVAVTVDAWRGWSAR
ncbi:TIGR03668 family PPOX class F420-dependent oxidoreductase [Intrasporangium flavum]|uniref:TIGR03668 family PPOX class F420-dependent oxidoreductase n=1 Tax=Intrasporangium flavum TaxID=1428657 RepID=UPI001A96CDAD|nr:TIGR03668 family PPOX class F420-dependent oxidoreductase [Intrasporangium flavum]